MQDDKGIKKITIRAIKQHLAETFGNGKFLVVYYIFIVKYWTIKNIVKNELNQTYKRVYISRIDPNDINKIIKREK